MSEGTKEWEWVCCFCGGAVDAQRADSIVLSVQAGKDWATGNSDPETQGLMCHPRCLRERVLPDIPLLFEGDD